MELEIILKIFLAAVLGGIVGLERELSHQESGLKLNILIAMATALLTVLSLRLAGLSGAHTEVPSPIIGHIITVLGLLGTGIIIKERFTIQGMGRASIILLVGAIGIAVGSGYYITAFGVTIFLVIILTLLKRLSQIMEKQGKIYAYFISTEENASIIIEIKKIILDLGINYINSKLRKTRDGFEIELALATSQTKNKAFIERVMQIPDIKEIISENL